ncbi:MAG TPA: copper resistance protein CopC, partial [Nitrolancea sp.]|nr:copper resistance protein CopC [Nitrolancea sp.]
MYALWERARGRRASAALLPLILLLALWPVAVSAHAFLDTSNPTANAVVATSPSEIKMEFTERIVPSASSAQLYNADAVKVATPASHIGATAYELILPLPPNLPKGTYTVQWQNVSADDGHPNNGYFAFTIGTQSNIVLPSPPPAPALNTAIVSLASISRWLSLLGLAGLIGSLLIWRWVIVPAIAELTEPNQRRIARNIRRFAYASIAVAVVGSILIAVAQARTSGGVNLGSLWTILGQSRFGRLLLLGDALLLVLAAILWRPNFWSRSTGWRTRWFELLIIALAPLPDALNSHAAAIGDGAQSAVTTDWLHLVAASVWIGGLLTLVIGLVLVRSLSLEHRRGVYAEAIPRFSTIAIIATITLGVTGFYAAWLEVGNLDALLHTTYGHTLIVKLVTIVPLLALGAVNLLVVGPAMRRGVKYVHHFGRIVAAEAVLGVTIFAIVGVLTGLPTAREVVTFSSGHPAYSYN